MNCGNHQERLQHRPGGGCSPRRPALQKVAPSSAAPTADLGGCHGAGGGELGCGRRQSRGSGLKGSRKCLLGTENAEGLLQGESPSATGENKHRLPYLSAGL